MDPEQLAELLDQHAPALALYASQWTTAADDIVQEAFIRLIDELPPPNSPVSWLYKVVRNLALTERRADTRRRRREAFAADRLVAPSPDVAVHEIRDALDRLDEETREVVVAYVWGGLTFQEIAELTGSSSSAVHRRYRAGLVSLRKALDQPCLNRST